MHPPLSVRYPVIFLRGDSGLGSGRVGVVVYSFPKAKAEYGYVRRIPEVRLVRSFPVQTFRCCVVAQFYCVGDCITPEFSWRIIHVNDKFCLSFDILYRSLYFVLILLIGLTCSLCDARRSAYRSPFSSSFF